MSVKKQFLVIKENWLLVVLALVFLGLFIGGGNFVGEGFDTVFRSAGIDKGYVGDSESLAYYPDTDGNFAPEDEERKITRSSSLSAEIGRGEFKNAEEQLKNIIESSGAYLLNERVNRNGEGWRGYYYGHYSLKIDNEKYEAVVAQLKEIGEIQDFNENMIDVTGRYDDLEIEIEVEKQRLNRYLEMFEEADETEYKIELNDRIFDQERRIKYLEDSLRNIDNKIDYSSISFSMTEERTDWANIALVKISDLIRALVDSLNTLLKFLFGILPWVIIVWIVWSVWKVIRR